jgi:hypothetical protein
VVDTTDAQRPRRRGVYLLLLCSGEAASISVNPDSLTTRKSSFDVVADYRDASS